MKSLRYLLLILFIAFGALRATAANTFDWVGGAAVGSATSWTNGLNWKVNGATNAVATLYPGTATSDVVRVGSSVAYSGNNPILNNGTALTITSLTIGGAAGTTPTLTISSALTVSGATTVNSNSTVITSAVFTTSTLSVTGATFTLGGNMAVTSNSASAINFVSGTTLFNGTSSTTTVTGGITTAAGSVTYGSPITCASFTITGGTYNSNATVTSSGAIALSGSSTLNTAATFSGTTLSVTSATLNLGASCTLSGAITSSTGTITSTAGTLTTTAIAMNVINNTFNLSGVLNCSGNLSVPATTPDDTGNTLTTNASGNIIGGIELHSGAALSWSGGTGSSTTVNGTSEIYVSSTNGPASLTVNAGNNVNFTAQLQVDASAALTAFLYNYGNLTFTSATLAPQSPSALAISIYNYSGGTISLTGTSAKIAISGDVDLSNAGTISTTATSSPTTPITTTNPCQIDNSGTMTMNNGTVSIVQGTTFNNNSGGTYTGNGNTMTFAAGSVANNTGTMAFNATSTLTLSGNAVPFTNNTGAQLNLNASTISLAGGTDILNYGSVSALAGSTINFSSNPSYILDENSASSLTVDASTVTIIAGTYIDNYGTFTTRNNSSVSLTGNPSKITNELNATTNTTSTTYTIGAGATITNTGGNFTATSCTFNESGNPSTITNQNSGSVTGNFYMDGCTLSATGTNKISNSGLFEAYDGTTLSSTSASNTAVITNNSGGTFMAGLSNSACVININGQSSGITNNGTFVVGSTSIINLLGGTGANVTNNVTNGFTLMSDQYGSATIGQISTATLGLSGTFNVQRYISAIRNYRLLSSPTNQKAAAQSTYLNVVDLGYLAQAETTPGTYYGAYTAGPSGSNFPNTNAAGNPVVYLYQESLQPGAAYNQSFTSGNNVGVTNYVSSGTASTLTTKTTVTTGTNNNQDNVSSVILPMGNGILLYYIGPSNISAQTGVSATSCNITATGYLTQGNVTVYLWGKTPSSTLTNTSASRVPGLVMLGNPYASTIDLHTFYTDNSASLNGTFYELNDATQQFPTYNGSSNTVSASPAGGSEYVASGQGFYAVGVAGKTLTFKETEKTTSTTSAIFPGTLLLAALPQSTRVENAGLHLKLSADSIQNDECGIYFSANWKDTYDQNDSFDLDGMSPKVYLSSYTSDNVRTSINALGDYTYGKRIKLYVKAITDGIYHLSLADITNIDTTNFKVYLIDTKLNDSLDMVQYRSYAFNFYTADTASFANRFVLALERKPTAPYSLITFMGQKATGGIQLNWNTVNEGNYTSFGLEKLGSNGQYALIDSVQSNGSGVYAFNDQKPVMGNNIYRLAQNDIHGNVTFAGPINISYNTIAVSGMFTIYPNPSKDLINIAVNSGITGSQATPVYLASIYDLAGTMMDAKQINTNNWTQDITTYKAGVYILELKTSGGDIIGKAKFVKTN
jgi:trimeric autotransporter adhesin